VLQTPVGFAGVGQAYADFRPVPDDEVQAVLRSAARPASLSSARVADPPVRDEEVELPAGLVELAGHLTVPERPTGLVVFVHGSGSSRHSPRNR
jgi:putative phosphoribosyl transferase